MGIRLWWPFLFKFMARNRKDRRDRGFARQQTPAHGAQSNGGKIGRAIINEYDGKRLVAKHMGMATLRSFLNRVGMAMNPNFNSPVRTLADMSEQEKRAIEIRLGAKIGRPGTPTT